MNLDASAVPAPGLNQVERVVDAYIAPSKTFADIRRSASWWLPFLLSVIIGLAFAYSVDRQIGFEQVAQANVNRSAQMQDRMATLSDAQRQQMLHTIATSTRIISYAYPFVAFIVALIVAGILMVSFNLGLGASAPYKQYLAVWFYASLPFVIKYLLAAIVIFAGAGAEQFDMRNPVGTNIGWYLTDAPQWLRTLCSSADIFTIWVVVLLTIGCATIAKISRGRAAIVVVGWWLFIIVAGTVVAGVQG